MARVASSWIEAKDRRRDQLQLVMNDKEVIHEPWGEIVIRETDENGIEVRAQRMAIKEFLRVLIRCICSNVSFLAAEPGRQDCD